MSMRECRGLVASIALVTLACSPAAKERQAEAPAKTDDALALTLENIYRRGRSGASNPAISPDGTWVTFTARTPQGQGIHRLSLKADASRNPQLWTEGSDAVWAPDSRSIVLIRGDRLFRIGVDETEAKALTEPIKGLRAPVVFPRWWDHRVLLDGIRTSGCLAGSVGRREPRQLTERPCPPMMVASSLRGHLMACTIAYRVQQGRLLGR